MVFLLLVLMAWAAPKPQVFVENLKSQKLSDLLTYPVRVRSKIQATVLSEIDGVVTKISVRLGDRVKKGQELFIVKHTDPVFQYAPVLVTSPVLGVVSSLEITEGSRVTRSQNLGSVIDPNQVIGILEIAAKDLDIIHTELKGTFQTPNADQEVAVEISGVSPLVDPTTGTATAELTFPKQVSSQTRWVPRPGLVGRVHFHVHEHQGFALPEEAVIYRGNDPFLRLVEDGKAKLVPVKLGASRQGKIEILNGVQDGFTAIVRASQYVANGDEVVIQNEGKSE